MCVCVCARECVVVCMHEREREREKEEGGREGERGERGGGGGGSNKEGITTQKELQYPIPAVGGDLPGNAPQFSTALCNVNMEYYGGIVSAQTLDSLVTRPTCSNITTWSYQ